jgi:hypothetical protein
VSLTPDDLAAARRPGFLLRVNCDPVIRLWSGRVRDQPIPAGGPETTDGAVYNSHGKLGGIPQLAAAVNGEAARMNFAMSGVGISGEIAALATIGAADIRGVAVDVGLILFDQDWELIGDPSWMWSGTADSLNVKRDASPDKPSRAIELSTANVFAARKQPSLSYYTPIDQARRSPDDNFCSEVPKLYDGTTKVWGQQ